MIRAEKTCIVVLILVNFAFAVDLNYTGIAIVTDDSRYAVLHPECELSAFDKTHYVSGQYVFSSGKRISGDRLILNSQDSIQFTKSEDVEALLRYPSSGGDTNIITQVQIYAAVSSEHSDTFFVDGGINKNFCEILLAYNNTNYVEFELFMYGY